MAGTDTFVLFDFRRLPCSLMSSHDLAARKATMVSATRSTCATDSDEPLGSVRPRAKSVSAAPAIAAPAAACTGCRCIGFHSGRVSMSWVPSALARSAVPTGLVGVDDDGGEPAVRLLIVVTEQSHSGGSGEESRHSGRAVGADARSSRRGAAAAPDRRPRADCSADS